MGTENKGLERKRVFAKKYFKFSEEATRALSDKKKRTGRTEVQIVEDAITGRDRFAPDVEAYIAAEMKKTGLPRDELIARALQTLVSTQGKKARRQ